MAAVTSSIFLPSIPQMSADLDTTASVINYTVAIFLVTIGIAPLFWSPLSGFYGRRPIYLVSMPIHVAASIGVALSNNVGAIIGTRILQGFGGSCVVNHFALTKWVYLLKCSLRLGRVPWETFTGRQNGRTRWDGITAVYASSLLP